MVYSFCCYCIIFHNLQWPFTMLNLFLAHFLSKNICSKRLKRKSKKKKTFLNFSFSFNIPSIYNIGFYIKRLIYSQLFYYFCFWFSFFYIKQITRNLFFVDDVYARIILTIDIWLDKEELHIMYICDLLNNDLYLSI